MSETHSNGAGSPTLSEPLRIGDVTVPNRVLLAPLAGIGSWFVRLQARRHGAGLAVSEMVSSFALHYRNPRTLRELLVVHPDEHPVSIQLFGHDPEKMRSGAAIAAEAGADLIDVNMGCPVRKVCKTGAGAALLADPDRAVRVARAAIEGGGRPVTVKLRSGLKPGDRSGFELALRMADAGVAAIGFHPRSASQEHGGDPDYALARELAGRVGVPMILSGGLRTAERARRAHRESGAAAVMIARGSLGNPWIFGELTGARRARPTKREIVAELLWVMDRAEEHLGPERATPYLRKFYPWYLERLGASRDANEPLQRAGSMEAARELATSLFGRIPRGPWGKVPSGSAHLPRASTSALEPA